MGEHSMYKGEFDEKQKEHFACQKKLSDIPKTNFNFTPPEKKQWTVQENF